MTILLYTARRVLWTIPTLLGALVVIFFLTQAVPGDAALARVGQYATPEAIAAVKRSMGTDKPLLTQFWIYLGHLGEGNLGFSWKTGNDVTTDLAERLPATVELMALTLLIAVPLGIALGVLAAARPDGWTARGVQAFSVLGLGIPVFWLSLMAVYLFFFVLGWLPAPTGRLGILDAPPPHSTGLYTLDSLLAGDGATFKKAAEHLALPVGALVFITAAPIARLTFSSMKEQLASDYARAASANGMPRALLLRKYALKNIMIPLVTMIGVLIRTLLGGAILVEVVFAWPGIGRYTAESILVADLAPLQAVVLIVTGVTLLVNILVDVSYLWLDPRIRVGRA